MKTHDGEHSGRLIWVDAWKAILIILVVMGHVFGTAAHYVPTCISGYYSLVFKIIYSFHMPAFFMLAGLMTSKKSRGISVMVQFQKQCRRLLIPYFTFGSVAVIIYLVAMPYFSNASIGSTGYYDKFMAWKWWHPLVSILYGASFPGTDGFRCNSVLWFLPCMFSVKVIGMWLLRLVGTSSRAVRLAILLIIPTVFLGWVSQFAGIPSLPYGLSNVLWYFPFFLIGYSVRSIIFDGIAMWLSRNLWVIRIAYVLMLAVFAILVWRLPHDTIYSRIHLRWYLVEVVLGILGSFLSMGIAMKMPIYFSRICYKFSMNSIGIMFLHKYIILGIMLIPVTKCLWFKSFPVGIMVSFFVIIVSAWGACSISSCVRRFMPWAMGEVRDGLF